MTKLCPRCKTQKSIDDFGCNAATPDGKNIYCRPCANQLAKEARQRKLDRSPELKARSVAHRAERDRRATA